MGIEIPKNLKLVPVDFESEDWGEKVVLYGLDINRPVMIVSTGVTMYLSQEANINTLKNLKKFTHQSLFATTFMLPPELLPSEDRALLEFSMKKAAESGTPFISLFKPEEILNLSKEAGLNNCTTVLSTDIISMYFKNRTDKLMPAIGECFLIVDL